MNCEKAGFAEARSLAFKWARQLEIATPELSGEKSPQPVQETMGRYINFKIQKTNLMVPSFPTGNKENFVYYYQPPNFSLS